MVDWSWLKNIETWYLRGLRRVANDAGNDEATRMIERELTRRSRFSKSAKIGNLGVSEK